MYTLISSMKNNKKPNNKGMMQKLPFASASPALLNYYIYGVTVLTFAVLAMTKTITPLAFAIHAVASLALILFFNLFIHCMVFGGCMKTALGVVTVVQVAHLSIFLYLTHNTSRD